MVKVYRPTSSYASVNNTELSKLNFNYALSTYGKLITVNGESTGSSSSFYTVPTGKTFFILTYSFTVTTNTFSANTGNAVFFIDFNNTQLTLAREVYFTGSTQDNVKNYNYTFNPSVPITITSGRSLGIYSGHSTITANCVVVGYEIDTSLLPRII